MNIFILILIVLCFILLLLFIGSENRLTALQKECENAPLRLSSLLKEIEDRKNQRNLLLKEIGEKTRLRDSLREEIDNHIEELDELDELDEEILQQKVSINKNKRIHAPSRFEDVVYHTQLHGEVLKPDLNEADPESPFYGKKVVITGEFPIPRKELGNILKKHLGADIDSSITERTDFVLVGEDPGPAKMEKVDEYGIETMEADELMPIVEPYLNQ